jgi:hypothetical protein
MVPKDITFYAKYLRKNMHLIHSDTFKLFFIYNQEKSSTRLGYIRIDDPYDLANLLGHRKITKFYKEELQRNVEPHFQEQRTRTC